MPIEKRFVDGDVLDGYDALFAFQLEHAVNQQQRIPVGQNLQDVVNIERRLECGRVGHRWSALSHVRPKQFVSISLKIILYRVAFTAWPRPGQREDIVPVRKTKTPAAASQRPAAAGRLRHFEQRQRQMVETIRE